MTAAQEQPSELPKLDELIGRDIRAVRQEFNRVDEESESRTQFDKILEAARLAVGAERTCIGLEGTVPLDNGHQLCVYIDRETRAITRLEDRNGPLYQSILQAEGSPDPSVRRLADNFVKLGGYTFKAK